MSRNGLRLGRDVYRNVELLIILILLQWLLDDDSQVP